MTKLHPYSARIAILAACAMLLLAAPASAFTSDSLDITVDKGGDATAVFHFTLEGIIENAIPQSVLEEQLVKGLAGSNEPPQLVSMDRSSATLFMKKFAITGDVPTGTSYTTRSMDFKKAEIALQNSAVSSVITADFSPATATVRFPDGYSRTFSNAETLPSLAHTIVDPAKAAAAGAQAATTGGAINVTGSPAGAEVLVDGTYVGTLPSTFPDIPAGSHTLTFQKSGYTPVTKNVNVTGGRTLRVFVNLAGAEPTTRASPLSPLCLVAGIVLAAGIVILAKCRRE